MAKIKGTAKKNVLHGTNAADTILGLGGNDTMSGGKGKDKLFGGKGNDRLFGGNGNDQLNGDAGNDTLAGGAGNDNLNGGAGDDSLQGDDGNDSFSGGDGVDQLHGNNGNDTMLGGSGDDMLFGDAGDDVLSGGAGADTFNGGAGSDWVDYSIGDDGSSGMGVDVDIDDGDRNDLSSGDKFISIENLRGTNAGDFLAGTSTNNILEGLAGNDVLYGYEGDDIIYGGTGADELLGHSGWDIISPGADTDADIIDGGSGYDTVSYSDATAGVKVNLQDNKDNDGQAINDTYVSIEAVIGSRFNDLILLNTYANGFGGDGDDLIGGSANSNVLQGGAGQDDLFGHGGADQFWLQNDMGTDRIWDFSLAEGDKIRISKADFGIGSEFDSSLFQSSADGAFVRFSGPQFILNQSNGTLSFSVAEIDSDVGFTSTTIAIFNNGNTVTDLPTISDFLIV